MKQIIKSIKTAVALKIAAKLPTTDAELQAWTDSILDLGGWPRDNKSLRHALATQLMHLPDRVTKKPKQFFIDTIKKAMVNQAAFNAIEAIRTQDREEAARRQQELDVTPTDGQDAQKTEL